LGAFLPFHIEFFALGGISYVFYKTVRKMQPAFSLTMPTLLSGFLLCLMAGRNLLPVAIWLPVLGMIVDVGGGRETVLAEMGSRLFTNTGALFFGRISYSVYLSHTLIIVITQASLFRLAPDLDQWSHLVLLFGLSFPLTLLASSGLYASIERPGIAFGQWLGRQSKSTKAFNPAPA
jgi:peptidoglycan/LPS O-acetylase OafA/YrhL